MLRSRLRILDRSPNPNPNPKMGSIKLQFRARNTKTSITHSRIFIFALIAVSIALACYLFSCYINVGYKKYSIVIDGGSTGTRVHVFGYEVLANGLKRFDFGENGLWSMRVNPGLSAYVENPDRAGGSLGGLVEFAKRRVPKGVWGETEVRLMATAGLRMVELGAQGRILDSCRRVLEGSGFVFRDEWASVITGSDEGLYAWVVANYALGTLGGDPLNTTGIIELGGASAQVTFVSSEQIPTEYSHSVRFGNITYNLYSHSLLQFGQNVAFDLLHDSLVTKIPESVTDHPEMQNVLDPCTPSGFTHDTIEKSKYHNLLSRGNFTECRSAALRLLQKGKDKCLYEHCYIGSTFIPKLRGKFLATENFFHTGKFFGLDQRAFISNLMKSGQQFCEDDWSKLRKKYPLLEEDDLRWYCFSSAYIVAFLHDSLGISVDDERIAFANQVEGIPLDWALGAFILQSTTETKSENPNWISSATSTNDSSTVIVLVVLALILVLSVFCLPKWRKPKLKTIYDLEKGKYIITRMQS